MLFTLQRKHSQETDTAKERRFCDSISDLLFTACKNQKKTRHGGYVIPEQIVIYCKENTRKKQTQKGGYVILFEIVIYYAQGKHQKETDSETNRRLSDFY